MTKKLMLIIAGLLLTKLILLLTSVPTPDVDYLAQANELSKPDGFTPEANAAPLYEQAFSLYVEPSEELRSCPLLNQWHRGSLLTGIDPNELTLGRVWLAANQSALEQVRLAARKPYCWFERISEENSLIQSISPGIEILEKSSSALICSAQCGVLDKAFQAAVNDLLDGFQIGLHLNRPGLSEGDQFTGTIIQKWAVDTAFEAVVYTQPSADEMASLQQSLESLLTRFPTALDFEQQKLGHYDIVQRLYLDPIRGIDRPAFRVLISKRGLSTIWGGNRIELWPEAFRGPSRHRVLCQIDHLYELHEQLKDKTPWQIHRVYQPQYKEAAALSEDGFFMAEFVRLNMRIISFFQETRARTQALVTVLAVLRFQQDRGRLPESLEALAEAGYIKEPPLDPFSDGPLVYRVEGEDFVLYSRGEDFTDNGGELVFPGAGQKAATCAVFSSLSSKRTVEGSRSRDIIYWPVVVELPDLSVSNPGEF